MNRRIDWRRTDGNTHRVTITEERPLTEDETKSRDALNRLATSWAEMAFAGGLV